MNSFQPEPVPQKLSREERAKRYEYLAQEKEQVKTLLEETEAEPVIPRLTRNERLENYQMEKISSSMPLDDDGAD